MSKWVLVVGYGSIGRRHCSNLLSIGCEDVRLLRCAPPRPGSLESPEDLKVYRDPEEAWADAPWAVVVANPSSLHVETSLQAIRAGAHVLLEKPVSGDLESARELLDSSRSSSCCISMAYCFRYHPLYRAVHDAVSQGRLGRIFHAHTWQGQFLPAWHPWEDYHDSYAARVDLGGGVVRTLDHDLDMVRWVLGQPVEVLASAGALSGIGVEVEDTADMIFRHPDRVQASVHVSFARQDYARGMWVVGEKGSVNLDWNASNVRIFEGAELAETIDLPGDFDLNTIYVEMLRDALTAFEATPPVAAIPLDDGVAALEMALGSLTSSEAGKVVQLKGAE